MQKNCTMRNSRNNKSSEKGKRNFDSPPPKKYGRKNFKSKSFSEKPKTQKSDDGSMRLNQFLAHAGICSRREADKLIEAGVVQVNGKGITQMGYRVQETDIVKFNGSTIKSDTKRYLLLNKARNYSTRIDDFGKKTSVFELIKGACKENLLPVGKLDKNHSGLLLFTNDDKLSRKLSHPEHEMKKIYHISLDKTLKSIDLKKIKDTLKIDDSLVPVDSISYVMDKEKTEIGLEIKSGKKQIAKKIFEHLGYRVLKLDLVFFGGLTKKNLSRKEYRFLTTEEVNLLKRL